MTSSWVGGFAGGDGVGKRMRGVEVEAEVMGDVGEDTEREAGVAAFSDGVEKRGG